MLLNIWVQQTRRKTTLWKDKLLKTHRKTTLWKEQLVKTRRKTTLWKDTLLKHVVKRHVEKTHS